MTISSAANTSIIIEAMSLGTKILEELTKSMKGADVVMDSAREAIERAQERSVILSESISVDVFDEDELLADFERELESEANAAAPVDDALVGMTALPSIRAQKPPVAELTEDEEIKALERSMLLEPDLSARRV